MVIYRLIAMTLLMLATLTGCGGSVTTKATGTVSVDGKLVGNGKIVFYPTDGGRSGSGEIKEDGSFLVSYMKMGDGLPPGEYKVTIVSDILQTRGSNKNPGSQDPEADEDGAVAIDPRGGKLTHTVPVIYNSRETTPLNRTIPKDAGQVYDFNIETKKR